MGDALLPPLNPSALQQTPHARFFCVFRVSSSPHCLSFHLLPLRSASRRAPRRRGVGGTWGSSIPVYPLSIFDGTKHRRNGEDEKQRNRGNGSLLFSPSPCPSSLSSEEFIPISEEAVSETKRLVETAMLAAATGLAYFLSNSFRIENYFGCFFPLPLVISSLRWGAAAGRKTMVATAVLLLVLSGPIRAASYLLMHGFLGLTMGALWRLEVRWVFSLMICTLVRSMGAIGFVLLSSWLLRDNLLALITINAHASIAYLLSAMGINFVPSMGTIYFIFGSLVLVNCGSFVFLLHILYVIFQKRLGLESSLILPTWLARLCN